MFKALKLTVVATSVVALFAACGGGGGGGGSTSTGGVYYTHEQLAQAFVNRAYGDAGLDLKLVKTNTLQSNYIVVHDQRYDTYDAYYIGNYNVGENIASYIDRNESKMYYDLDYVGGNMYEDWYTGLHFEETSATSKDLEKAAAFKQGLRVKKSADALKAEFGLSEQRANEVARLAVYVADNKAKMKDKDFDAFSAQLLGSSITQAKAAHKAQVEGNSKPMADLIAKAAKVNGVGPEHASQIIDELFSK